MSMAEIIEELPRLEDSERQTILQRLLALDSGFEIEETPEMLDAIDDGIRSVEAGSCVPLKEARQRIAGWITK